MKIVILDGYTENPGDLNWEPLKAFGDLTVYDRTPYDDAVIAERIGDAEAGFRCLPEHEVYFCPGNRLQHC